MTKSVVILAAIWTCSISLLGQTAPDPQIMQAINSIKALDNHTHVPKVVRPGEKDDEYDALPCGGFLEPVDDPWIARPDNPRFLQAWKALYGYRYNDKSPQHLAELRETISKVRREQGENFPTWVLDKLGIEYMMANRVGMGPGLKPPRFMWVPFDDALMLPLNNQSVANDTPDRKFFYGREEMLLKRYMSESGVDLLPATLDEYVTSIIKPTLERQKKAGAVAVKFEAAYLRTLNFGDPEREEAARIYAQHARGGVPGKADYLKVQNALFREIAGEAGRLGLAVHIHTGAGCGGYFEVSGANPGLLDTVLNDASLRKTNFVLIHGGSGPFTKVTAFELSHPNVYADFSEQDWMISTRALSGVVRDWLEWYPEKVIFGTDLFPGSTPEYDWDSIGYVVASSGREALALALTGMMNDGEITRKRALELARMVLIGNAAKLYGLP
ncbi:MAG TPA: amidohydrolase family protein [Terriglobales bacterium]|nr:amidohydrolase family protein [Terriglobales bacterium]